MGIKAMKVLITGADGFIGKNLAVSLKNKGCFEILRFGATTDRRYLDEYTRQCDFVFHLAGVNRHKDPEYFLKGNTGFTSELLDCLRRCGSKAPIVYSSSIHAVRLDNYGLSKKAAEGLIDAYASSRKVPAYIYRLSNVFGKWNRPNYNSAIATFCHNASRDLAIEVEDPEREIKLVYIDDVVREFMRALEHNPTRDGEFCHAGPVYDVNLGYLESIIKNFAKIRAGHEVPDLSDDFIRKLYAVYLSYIPEEGVPLELKTHRDARGYFAEFIRTPQCGQVSINVSKPGVTKGNHYHHTKSEKFLVVSGKGEIRLRRLDAADIAVYEVDGSNPRAIEIPPGFAHNIVNTGNVDLITVIWSSEVFDPDNHDTWPAEVEKWTGLNL